MLDYRDIREILSKDVTDVSVLQNICMKVQYYKRINYNVGETLLKVVSSDCNDVYLKNNISRERNNYELF